MTDEAKRYLDKAEHALEVAEDLLKDGHAPDAASKIYYFAAPKGGQPNIKEGANHAEKVLLS